VEKTYRGGFCFLQKKAMATIPGIHSGGHADIFFEALKRTGPYYFKGVLLWLSFSKQ
jgi:hypothetical protein